MKFKVNGKSVTVEIIHEDTPLLWVLRDQLGLAGTKFGCGIGQCGACTVLLDDAAIFSCSVPISLLEGREITTIDLIRQISTDSLPSLRRRLRRLRGAAQAARRGAHPHGHFFCDLSIDRGLCCSEDRDLSLIEHDESSSQLS